MSKWLAFTAAVVLATGCNYGASAFHCDTDTQCGADGTCEPGFGLCSFPSNKCGTGGREFGDLAGDHSGKCVEGEQPIDAGTDPTTDGTPGAQACFGNGLLHICLAAPTQPLMISDATTIDTANPSMCAVTVSGADNYCVVAATSITIDATLRAKGIKPLVLIASDSITVNQLIDVGSHRTTPEFIGAGADPVTCMPGTLAAGARSGGAGGSFTGKGGNGGDGAAGGGNGGQAVNGTNNVTVLRGGCSGQAGAGNGKGNGGHGGGAVYLIAGTRIAITGPGINAAGEGGDSGKGGPVATPNASGAGGGGSGGMIGFDAPTLTCTSLLLANGGAGGEGSGVTTDGAAGTDPIMTAAAPGGTGNSTIGGDGGNGSTGAAAGAGANGKNGASSGANDGGGGGGGGAAGLIKGPAAALGNNVSPDATP